MKWRQVSPFVIESPPYRICKMFIDGFQLYRPSFRGEFIGPVGNLQAAKSACEDHAAAQEMAA